MKSAGEREREQAAASQTQGWATVIAWGVEGTRWSGLSQWAW